MALSFSSSTTTKTTATTLTRRLKRQGYDNVVSAEHGRHALDLLAARALRPWSCLTS